MIHAVMAYPDPFGGEHEDFMPCGCNDPAMVVDDTIPYDEHPATQEPVQPEPVQPEPEFVPAPQQVEFVRDPLDDPDVLC